MLTVFDIGVRGGPDPRWHLLGNDVCVIGFDADPEECTRLSLQTFAVPFFPIQAALGAVDGAQRTLYLTRHRGCSSLLEPNRAYLNAFPYAPAFDVEAQVPVTLTTLDRVWGDEGLRVPDVLKIDTQGTELDILHGAEQTLRSVSLVELEVEFNPLYVGQPLFGDVDAYLRARGFSLLGLRRTAWRRDYTGALGGTIVHGDALWIREPSDPDRRQALGHALLAYRQHDYARTLGVAVNGHATPSLLQRIVGRLSAQVASHRRVRAWLDRSRPSGAVDWHDPDFF